MIMRIGPIAIVAAFCATAPAALARDLEPAAPASVGMTQAGIDQLRADMKAIVDEGRRAGVVFAVARRGKLVAEGAYGLRNVEQNLPMQMDTQYRLASLSRVLTGATILALVDEGKLAM